MNGGARNGEREAKKIPLQMKICAEGGMARGWIGSSLSAIQAKDEPIQGPGIARVHTEVQKSSAE